MVAGPEKTNAAQARIRTPGHRYSENGKPRPKDKRVDCKKWRELELFKEANSDDLSENGCEQTYQGCGEWSHGGWL